MVTTYQQKRHDIGITNIGADGAGTDLIGMMLAQRPDGTPAYEEYDARYLADQFFTGRAEPVNINPEEELILYQDDWRAGFGLEYFDYNDLKRYLSSIGADLRFKGMAIAGYAPTAVTVLTYTAVDIIDGGMEIWTAANDLTYWTETAGITQDAVEQRSGTYCAKSAGANLTAQVMLKQSLDWNIEYRSKLFTFKAWIKTVLNNMFRIAIYDGVGRAYSSYHGGGGGYEELTIMKQLSASATELTVEFWQGSTMNPVAYFDDASLTAPTEGKTTAYAEFNDKLYMSRGKSLVKLKADGTGFDYVHHFDAEITDLEPFTDDNLYIAFGFSDAYWYMSTAEVFTPSNAVVSMFKFFKTVHAAVPILYGSDSVNTIRSNTNPINEGAVWSDITTVGSSYYDITDLVTKSGALYILKEDMPYYLNSAGAVQNDLAPELQTITASTSGKNTVVWKNRVYIPAGQQALLEVGATNIFRNPSSHCTNLSDFVGRVQALGYDEEYLFGIVDNSTKIEILAGREEEIDNKTDWVWHPIAEITLTDCETAFVSSIYQKRLWVASTVAGESLYYLPLPTGYGNITGDANRKFLTGTYFTTPWLHGGFKSDLKSFIKVTGTLGHTYNANIYFTIAYQKLGDSSWTTVGNLKGTATDRKETLYIPADGSGNKPKSTMLRLKFTAATNDTTKTPILLNYEVRAILYPTIRKITHCVVRCAEEILCKNGIIDKNMYNTIKATLDNARAASWPVEIKDLDGNTKYIKSLPVIKDTKRMLLTKREKGREQERHYHLLMMEVPLS